MNIKKMVGLVCCVLGLANLSYAGGWPKFKLFRPKTSGNLLPGVPGQGFAPFSVANLELGRMMIQPTLPQIGGTAYTRQVAWGNRLAQFSPKVSERLVASRVLASQFPGFEMNFSKSYAAFKGSTDLSWTRELTDMLKTAYGLQAQFAGSFETSLQDVLALQENIPFKWQPAKTALEDAWMAGMKKTSGFFTIRVKSPVVPEGTDILLLDMANRQFISLNKSVFEVKREAAKTSAAPNYEPLPAGDLQVGQALLANQVENIFYPGYIPRFWRSYEAREREFGIDEWTKVLQTYGKDAYFYVDFKSSFKEVVSYRPEDALYWAGETEGAIGYHLCQVVGESTQKVGFLVVYLKRNNPAADTLVEEDVLIIDLENKRFISLEKSRRLAENHK